MTEIDEFKAKLRGETEAAMERIRVMQAQAAEQYREMQSNYVIFLDLSHRIRVAIRPWVEAFAESLPDVTPVVTERDFGPAGRMFHGGFVTFSIPRGERCPANIKLRFGLEAGVAVDSLILFHDLEIVPVFIEFERHDQVVLPLDPSSVEKAVEWFQRKASHSPRPTSACFSTPTTRLSFTHISLLTEVLTVINLAAIFHNTVHLFKLSNEPNENTITV